MRWCQRVIRLRTEHPMFRRRRWFQHHRIRGVEAIAWLRPDGEEMTDDDWEAGYARAVGVFLNGNALPTTDAYGERVVDDSFLLLFNASDHDLTWRIPGKEWCRRWTVELDSAEPSRGATRTVHRRPDDDIVVPSRSMQVLRELQPPASRDATRVSATPERGTP